MASSEKNIKAFHFAHSTLECEGAYETALHLLAKKIISEKKEIYTPDYYGKNGNRYSNFIFRIGKLVQFEDVKTEVDLKVEDIYVRPDAIGYILGKEVFIEFAKTHFIDFEKKEKLIKLKIPCIEINISNEDLNEENLTKTLLSENDLSVWITNPKLDKEYKEYQEKKRKQNQRRKEKRKMTL